MTFTLAIVGRPNVGKSTLFNRLVGKRLALVDDQPGVTRDLREGAARLGDLRFTVIDTAGLEETDDDSLQGRMRRLTERAVDLADICLFVIDARAGVTPTDEVFADILRRRSAHVILAANKAEGRAAEGGVLEAYALGLGEPLRISAEHGEGMGDLLGVLMPLAEAFGARAAAEAALQPETDVDVDADSDEAEGPRPFTEAKPLQVAVVGRPNAGKSTLINTLIGEDRLLTGPEAGITRDAISVVPSTRTARRPASSIRGHAQTRQGAGKTWNGFRSRTGIRAIKFAEVVIRPAGRELPFEAQDLKIADLAEREGARC